LILEFFNTLLKAIGMFLQIVVMLLEFIGMELQVSGVLLHAAVMVLQFGIQVLKVLTIFRIFFKKVFKFKYPTETMFMMDGTKHYQMLGAWMSIRYIHMITPAVSGSTRWHARHEKTINALLLDGHVQNYPYRNLPTGFPNFGLPHANRDVNVFWRGTGDGGGA